MNSRERIKTIIGGKEADRCGFFLGMPAIETWPIYFEYFGTDSTEEIRQRLKSDIRWIAPHDRENYRHVTQKDMFRVGTGLSHAPRGPLADCTNLQGVNAFNWPDAKELVFEATLGKLEKAGDYYRMSGMWAPFYHNCMDLFGMQEYLVKMITHPDVVEAVTDRVCTFYYEANERFFAEADELVDGYFFGNDFGTQQNLICSRDHFQRFIMPWFRRFTEQGHRHGHQVILHSCGSVYHVIEDLIDADVDCLNPLQARAANMDAETLAREFKGRIAFMGGIDTQDLLVNGSPEDVAEDVARVRDLLGPCLIISPSHDTLLPNVPPENAEAMARAAVPPGT
jgi:uroporphyrinogen decarboxylase